MLTTFCVIVFQDSKKLLSLMYDFEDVMNALDVATKHDVRMQHIAAKKVTQMLWMIMGSCNCLCQFTGNSLLHIAVKKVSCTTICS